MFVLLESTQPNGVSAAVVSPSPGVGGGGAASKGWSVEMVMHQQREEGSGVKEIFIRRGLRAYFCAKGTFCCWKQKPLSLQQLLRNPLPCVCSLRSSLKVACGCWGARAYFCTVSSVRYLAA